ncbi:MAG: adenosylcobinamide-GDP ribazoletransferase [Anaerolineae bacterium]
MPILLACKFLTILPIPLPAEVPPKTWGRAVAWYPLVGLVLGLLLAGADWLLGRALPPLLQSALVLALWVILTGALHLDGFLDCCDGLLAPVPPERRLEILRDVHTGSFAVAGGVLLLIVKGAALAALAAPLRLPALIATPVLARWAMSYAVVCYPYARRQGLGGLARQGAGARELAIATVVAAAVAAAAWRLWGLVALPLTWAFAALLAAWVRTRIPGLTGDTYGALCELTEAAWLVGLVALTPFLGRLPW